MFDRIRNSFRKNKDEDLPSFETKSPEIDLIKKRLFKICPVDNHQCNQLAVINRNSELQMELNARGTNFFYRYDCICPEEYPQFCLTLTETGLIQLEPFEMAQN